MIILLYSLMFRWHTLNKKIQALPMYSEGCIMQISITHTYIHISKSNLFLKFV